MDRLPKQISDMKTLNLAYGALIEASYIEMSSKESNFEAQLLSQTGFAFDDIKQLEYRFGYEIDDRSVSVDNPECIAIARIQLSSAAENSGTSSIAVFEEIIEEVTYIRFFDVYPLLSELNNLVDSFTIEPLGLLSYFNSASDIDRILNILDSEILLYSELFEGFVDMVINEMANFDYFYANVNQQLAESLDSTRQGFVNATDEIRDFLLSECV